MPAQAQSAPARLEPQRALHMGLGAAAAPAMWAAYFAAAGAGVTYWWMTGGWSRRPAAQPRLPEPKAFAAKPSAKVAVEPQPEPFREPVDLIEAATDALETAPVAFEAAVLEVAPAVETVETAGDEIEADASKPAPRKSKKSKA